MTSHRPFLHLLAFSLVALTGCRGGGEGGSGGGGGGEASSTGSSGATSLTCPHPGALPFTLESTGWVNAANETRAKSENRSKDEAADRLGTDAVAATTYDELEAALSAPTPVYAGKKASAPKESGLKSDGFAGEHVSLWLYDETAASWKALGRTDTDELGQYSFTLDATLGLSPGQPVYSILEADGSCAPHYDYLLAPGTKFIVTDIDGTMTLSDEELFNQIADGSYDPKENASASVLMNTWSDKGYPIVYLTARPHAFRAETRSWLDSHGFPLGPVVTANSLVFDESAREYKRTWVNRMLGDFGWEVVAAYGNASSDIEAYEDAGIPKDITFIVGPEAGASGTVGIDGNDYSSHIADFVTPYPDAP